MKLNHKGITTSVGYSFAFAALCSLAVSPGIAAAEELDTSSESSASSEPIVSDRSTNAPVPTEKSETVYVFANPDGSVKNTEVSTTLKNPGAASELADSSELTDIKNTESDNSYTGSEKNMVWDAAGENVYYTGNTTKEPPVSVKVSYFLDGKKISPDKLAGASGHLKIRYDYENNATVKANIRGKEETLYVPFTFITAALFDNEYFKNAEVTNGKLIDDGDRAIVAGYAMPGLKKSLGSIVDDFDIPSYFEVEADVTDFEMKSSLTIATAGLMSDINTDDIDTAKLEDASSELNDAMGQIIDGASSLESGLKKLSDGAKSANVATGKIAAGAENLAKGNKDLADGLEKMQDSTSALPDGIKKLATGASALADGLPDAVKGAGAIEDGAGELKGGLEQLKSGLGVAVGGIDSLDEGAQKLAGGLNALKGDGSAENPGLVGAQAGANTLSESLEGADEAIQNLAAEFKSKASEFRTSKAEIDAIAGSIADETVKEKLTALSEKLEGLATQLETAATELENSDISKASAAATLISNGLGEAVAALGDESTEGTIIYGANALDQGLTLLKSGDGKTSAGLEGALGGLGDASSEGTLIYGANAIENGAAQLKGDKDNGLTAASTGASALASGLAELNKKLPAMTSAIEKIVKGADKLADGSSELADGAGQIDEGLGTLAKGASSAASGSGKLTNGLETFADEGIGQITDLIDDDLLPFTDRLDALSKAGEEYDNFAGITKGTKGSVKFIFETDPIEKGE